MKFTKKSKSLINFFTQNKLISHNHNNKQTIKILTELYYDIYESYKFLNSLKNRENIYNISIKKINSTFEVVKPKQFNADSFPKNIRKHIDEASLSEITYTFSLFERTIKIYFIEEDSNVELKIEQFNKYINTIIMWLYILNLYSSKKCANNVVIYFYFTTLEKKIPSSNIEILDQQHVNTAFTYSCPKDSEIVIFRKEEWFKVFIHETFHNFGLDFSDMNNDMCNNDLLKIFKVNSLVNLFEAYTEFWAEIINVLFCSFFKIQNKSNISEFLYYSEIFINFERNYSFFQLVKTLNFMGLTYKDLYSNTSYSKSLRENLFKEKTNVLSYYIIKTILMNNYETFLLWCSINNFSLLQFKKTILNQTEFCKFIEKHYKNRSMISGVHNTELFISKIKNKNNFLMKNLRMSICELE